MALLGVYWHLLFAIILYLNIPIAANGQTFSTSSLAAFPTPSLAAFSTTSRAAFPTPSRTAFPTPSRAPGGNGTFYDGYNGTIPGNNNFTAPVCHFSVDHFRANLTSTCRSEIDAIQSCPTSSLGTKTRRELARGLSECAVSVYDKVNDCTVDKVPRYQLPPFESDDRLGQLGTYITPLSSNMFGKRAEKESEACKNPDIVPIFVQSLSLFHNETDGRWLGVQKTPYQYLRCVLQSSESEVSSCVVSSIRKLQYLPNRLIIYGGQAKCHTEFQILFQTIQKMVLEVLSFIFTVWNSRRKRKIDPEDYRSFSWVGLFSAVIVGIGTSAVQALIVRTQFPEHSVAAALGLYLLLPQAAPFIGFMSGAFLSKGFGTQTLLADLVMSGIALVMYNLPLKIWSDSGTLPIPAREGQPSTAFLYNGLYLATVPAGFVFAIYQGIVLLAAALFIWSCFVKSKDGGKALAKAAGYLIGLWILMWIGIISFAVFAIAEIIWLATAAKRKKKSEDGVHYLQRFPLLIQVRDFFYTDSFGRFMRTFGYWAWVLVSFMIGAGRWMFILQMLKLTGPAFCPDSLKGATAAGFLIPFAALGGNIVLKLYGLAL